MSVKKKVGRGRPTNYRSEYAKQAHKLCLLGATDKELADFFGIAERTLNDWKTAHPDFLQSLKEGKDAADAKVASRLFQRALGYSHKAVKILTVAGGEAGSHIEEVPYIERYPPDTTAAIFWLKNRRRQDWRDRQDVEHSGSVKLEQALDAVLAARANR